MFDIMDVSLEYIEELKTPFARKFLREIAERTLKECRLSFLQGKKISLNAIAVSESKIKKINSEYRGKDAVTDILSFGEYAGAKTLAQETKPEIFLGEIFFSPAFIVKRAKRGLLNKAEEAIMKEMAYIFSHGVLHLVGFNHGKVMFAIQEKVADLF